MDSIQLWHIMLLLVFALITGAAIALFVALAKKDAPPRTGCGSDSRKD